MNRCRHIILVLGALISTVLGAATASAQKPGGVLRIYQLDSPASLSIHEEATISAVIPAMGVFNNLVVYDQHTPQNSMASIVPELATEWAWDEAGTVLTFRLRRGVNWHDGKPFTAADVKCTWELIAGKANDKLRLNPRRSWYGNLIEVTVEGDDRVAFRLNRPQPAFIALLASGLSPIYPCHVAPRDMRTHPIGTGPFKLVDFRPNEGIALERNPEYWKPGRPYLDRIEYSVVRNPATANLAFIAGKFDLTFPLFMQVPAMREVSAQAPHARCELVTQNVSRNLLVNRERPPFDNAELRRAMALALDRRAFIDILGDGQGETGGAMQPAPGGAWGLAPEVLATLPGYGPDTAKSRAAAREIMERAGYGANRHLSIKVSSRNIPTFRDTATILIDQLKQIYIDGELELIETANWYPKITRRDYTIGMNVTANGVDDPDQNFYENYRCGAAGNHDGYCNPETDSLIDRQSLEPDINRRRELVWEIDRKLQENGARPIIFYPRGATCRQPNVKGLTIMVNSSFNSWRFEDVWLDNER